ncbi:MAG: 50S ribosomal protein L24 [Candidatus Micrarchaeia archaeon]
MIQSSKRRKQRKQRFSAPLHIMQKFAHAHISKELAGKLGIKRRSIEVRRGDTIKVMSGAQKGKSGKVSKVNLRKGFVYVEGITRKTIKGKEIMIPIRASKVYITDLDISDKYRKEAIDKMKVAK